MGGFANNAPIVTDGLVFYVDAGNGNSYPGSGTTWTDLSGSNNGTLTNGPTYDSANGGSIVFDGANDYAAMGTATNFVPTNDMTMDVWIKLDDYDACICMSPNSAGGNEMIFYIPASTTGTWVYKRLSCTFDNSDGASGSWPTSNTDIPLSTWVNVCLVRDGATARFYYNGIADGTGTRGTGTLVYATGQPLYLGTDTDGSSFTTGNFFDGKMSNFKLYNRALSASEVTQNYNALKNRFI
jgi:hypothetical protein